MTHLLSLQPQSLLSPINNPTKSPNSHFNFFAPKPTPRHSIGAIRFSFRPPSSFTDDLFSRTEGILYTLADAAVSISSSASESADGAKDSGDWFTGITNIMETVLKVLKDGLSAVHVPYSYGFAIILLTVLVKAATFPLTKKQVESAMAMKTLQPQIKAIQKEYAGDQERIQLETARLYKIAGVNPLAGCLPTVATIPVWIGLYRALSNVANEGLLTEGFFWIPSLAGPTTVAVRQNGSGVSWLFPFVDGHPPLGWSDTLAYLVLPLLLVVSQYISVQIIQTSQSNDPNMKTSQALTKILPLMIGYFALSVPSGLSLYWLTNNILSTTQQIWLQKLGGAKNPVKKFSDSSIIEVQQKLQDSVANLNSTKVVESRNEENSSGLRPGDRFRQLKEQEARKKRLMQEEKKKVSAKGTETQNKEQKKEFETAMTEDEAAIAKSDDVRVERVQPPTVSHDCPTGITHVNGEHSVPSPNEDQKKMDVLGRENGGASTTIVDEKEGLRSPDNLEQDDTTESITTTTSVSGVSSIENAKHEGNEHSGQKDEK